MSELTRYKKNEGKKRPICACGTEMTHVELSAQHNEINLWYWICENKNCKTASEFEPDIIQTV